MFSTLPITPILIASTGTSSSRQRAWSATQSASIASTPSTPAVSCTVSAVTTDSGWQPMLATVSRSACSPAPPDGSEAANESTIGGNSVALSAGIWEAAGANGGRLRQDCYNFEFYSIAPPALAGLPAAAPDLHDEEIHVPDLRLDLRRGNRRARRRHSARHAVGR